MSDAANPPVTNFASLMAEGVLSDGIPERLALATALAALPGEIVPVTRDEQLRMAKDGEAVAPHSPPHGIRRRCPKTGATLLETMLHAPVGPNPGHMAYDVHGAPGMRPFRIAVVLDVGHHGRDAMPGDDDPVRWPERSNAHARLAAALAGTTDLLDHVARGLTQPGRKAQDDARGLVQRLARMRVLVARTHAPEKARRVSDESLVVTLASPWTRPSIHASEWFAASRPDRGQPVLSPTAAKAFLDRMPVVAGISSNVVIDDVGERTDHYAFVQRSILVALPDDRDDDVVAAMRDVRTIGLAHTDFVF